jgi:hypothetical protein
VESVSAEGIKRDLDQLAGIDAWQVVGGRGIRGLACRALGDGRWTRMFTIRYQRDSGASTEYEKRIASIEGEGGWLLPHLTIQAYSHWPAGGLKCACVVRTRDLFGFVKPRLDDGRDVWIDRTNHRGRGGASFVCVPWDGLAKAGIRTHEVPF